MDSTPSERETVAVLSADEVGYQVGRKWLVRGVTARFQTGRFTALIGPNGAGKTTLLRLLCGDLTPSTGRAFLDGRETVYLTKNEQARRRAVLPQQSSLAFPMTVEEVVAMGRGPFAETIAETEAAVRRAMEQTDIIGLSGRDYLTLSGGERQRVHLARVWTQVEGMDPTAPRVLFLDEPTNNLDPLHRTRLLHAARKLCREGVAVVAVLHDFNEVLDCAHDVALMHGGRLEVMQPTAAVMTPEALEPVFQVKLLEARTPDGRLRLWPDEPLG
ncbi:MAG: heme ABC transporter ATP-binding protein [Verrucomicrobiota bacterium]